MKQPAPTLFIANPDLVLEPKIALWRLGNGFQLEFSPH